MIRRCLSSVGIAVSFLLGVLLILPVPAGFTRPLGRHCGDVGPLPTQDPAFCGCTWGRVLYHGQPVPGAAITLAFGTGVVTDVTRFSPLESFPYFDVTGYELGARRGDVFTLTASFNGQTITRAVRAWPETDGEQHVTLAFVEHGVWKPWITGSYTRALAADDTILWAAGSAGIISANLTSGVSVTQVLPGVPVTVYGLAVGPDHHVWAAFANGLFEFDGTLWHTRTVPIAGSVRAVAASSSGAIWLGGGANGQGQVAVLTDTWTMMGNFNAQVTALTLDSSDRVWVGTWGDGVYRQISGATWTHYLEGNGLASDYVYAIAADNQAVWFGTDPYLGAYGYRGGIGRYDLIAGTWRTYTSAQGLAADPLFPQSPAPVYALESDSTGGVWAGTIDGLRLLTGGSWWSAYTMTHGLRSGPVYAVAASGNEVAAASALGLDHFDPLALPGNPPTASIVQVSPLTVSLGYSLTLIGSAHVQDENGQQLVAWDWSSSIDGPLCSVPACTLPHHLLTPGVHVLYWRAQDDEGMWSQAATQTLLVRETWHVYLPAIIGP